MAISEKRMITISSDTYPGITGVIETADGETAKSEVFVDLPTRRVSLMCGSPIWTLQVATDFVQTQIAKYEEAMDQLLKIRDAVGPALIHYAARLSRIDG